ncbi:hypothetical protein BCR43DRAFT_490866 [Syncephalastrum racemosum]|uniref:Uncharacterized protein n=1 Tax=Syncephalastrum racemosum TaxID=13706 RepID=A0A1X2HGK2_SYNRA|nr:hypothetical protein BCR43DRAFT_490866 [Syncephalastrum racemosum]
MSSRSSLFTPSLDKRKHYNTTELHRPRLAKHADLERHLDRLEESLNAEFEQYFANTLNLSVRDPIPSSPNRPLSGASFEHPHQQQQQQQQQQQKQQKSDASILDRLLNEQIPQVLDAQPPFSPHDQSLRLTDASFHSDREILGDIMKQSFGGGIPDHFQFDEQYNVAPLLNPPQLEDPTPNRTLSPGQYFGARSLPLNSFDDVWQSDTKKHRPLSPHSEKDISAGDVFPEYESDSLEDTFKSLPESLKRGPECHINTLQLDHLRSLLHDKTRSFTDTRSTSNPRASSASYHTNMAHSSIPASASSSLHSHPSPKPHAKQPPPTKPRCVWCAADQQCGMG